MNWIKKTLTHGLSKKVIFAIMVLAAVDMFSMAAPYYLKYVIPNIYKYLNVTQAEYDQLNAVLGYVVLVFQIPSGIIADKISGKKLLIISVIMSGILTVLFGLGAQGFFPNNLSIIIMYIVFTGFGISTTLFLWSPLWKVLSDQSSKKEQSSLYGLQGTYNGIFGLIFITLIGTFATKLAQNNDNSLFYALVYIVAAALFISAIGIHVFVKESNYKSFLVVSFKNIIKKIKNFKLEKKKLGPFMILRVWLLSIFVLGMYMFQSIFAYYLKSYISLVLSTTLVAVIAGFRTYGLRTIVSGPFGKWIKNKKSWIFNLMIILLTGIIISLLLIFLGGVGNKFNTFSNEYLLFIKIIYPILYIWIGSISWFLVAGRYMQIEEIPHTKYNYGVTIAIISFIGFSSDAWFYQMVSSWMKSGGYVGKSGGYTQEGLQKVLAVAIGISLIGLIAGTCVFWINNHEIKKLNKNNYRWRNKEKKKNYEKNIISS